MTFQAATYTTGAGTNPLNEAPELGQLNYLEYDDANQKHVKVQLYDGKLYFQVRNDTSGNYNTPRSIQDKDIMLIRDMYGCFGNPRNLCLKFALNFPEAVIGDFTPSAKQALYRVFSQCVSPKSGSSQPPFPLGFPGTSDGVGSATGPFVEEALVTEMVIDTSYPQNISAPLSLGSAVGGTTGPETSGGVTVQVLQGVTVIFTIAYNGNGSTLDGNSETLLKKFLAGYVSSTGAIPNGLYWSLTNGSNAAKDHLAFLFAGVNNLSFKGGYSYTTTAATALETTGLLPSLINLLSPACVTSGNLSTVISGTNVAIPAIATMSNSLYNKNLLSTNFTQLLNYTPNLPTKATVPFSTGALNGATIANISQYLSADPRAQVIHKNVPAGVLSVKAGVINHADGNYVAFNVNLVGNWDHWGVKLNPLSFTNPSDINDNSYIRIRNGSYTTYVTSPSVSDNNPQLLTSNITVNTPFWITIFDKNYNPLYAYFNILSVTAANPAATPPELATATVNPNLAYRFSIANNYY